MLRQHRLEQVLARLDALEESDGIRGWGAPFYTLGGLARGIDRPERGASEQDADRQRAKEERNRRAREREARHEQRQMSGRGGGERSDYARESRERDVTRDGEDVDQEYEREAASPTRETDRTPKQRSPGSQTSGKTRGRGASRRRS